MYMLHSHNLYTVFTFTLAVCGSGDVRRQLTLLLLQARAQKHRRRRRKRQQRPQSFTLAAAQTRPTRWEPRWAVWRLFLRLLWPRRCLCSCLGVDFDAVCLQKRPSNKDGALVRISAACFRKTRPPSRCSQAGAQLYTWYIKIQNTHEDVTIYPSSILDKRDLNLMWCRYLLAVYHVLF